MKKTLFIFLLFSTFAFAEDDYIIGEYDNLNKLMIQENENEVIIVGEGKYLAGFLESFYDNLAGGYRDAPLMRERILERIKQAKNKNVIKIKIGYYCCEDNFDDFEAFENYNDNYDAYRETVGNRSYAPGVLDLNLFIK